MLNTDEQLVPPGKGLERTHREAEDLVECLIQAHFEYEHSGPNGLNGRRQKYLMWKEFVISALHTK